MADEALLRKLGFIRPAAAVALLLALAACTTGGSGGQADRSSPTTASGGQKPVDDRTRPSAVWSSGPQGAPRRDGAGEAVLAAVRAARQDGYDRLVFEFSGGLPGYQARYLAAQPVGSAGRIELDGTAFLLLTFDGASAGGFAQRDLHPGFGSMKQVRLVDEGDGRLRFGVGLDAVTGYLAHELTGPDRVIIDVAA